MTLREEVESMKAADEAKEEGSKNLQATIDLLMAKYFEMSLRYCLSQGEQRGLIDRMNELFADYKDSENENEKFDILKLS